MNVSPNETLPLIDHGEYAIKDGEITLCPNYEKLYYEAANRVSILEENVSFLEIALSIAVKKLCAMYRNDFNSYIANEIKDEAEKRMNPNG